MHRKTMPVIIQFQVYWSGLLDFETAIFSHNKPKKFMSRSDADRLEFTSFWLILKTCFSSKAFIDLDDFNRLRKDSIGLCQNGLGKIRQMLWKYRLQHGCKGLSGRSIDLNHNQGLRFTWLPFRNGHCRVSHCPVKWCRLESNLAVTNPACWVWNIAFYFPYTLDYSVDLLVLHQCLPPLRL